MDEKTEMQRWLETDKLWMLVSKGRLIYIRPGQSDLIHVLNHYFTSWRLPLAKYTDLSFIDSFLSTCLIPLYQPGCNTLKAYPVPKTINKWFHLDIIIIPFYWCQNGGTEIKFLGQGHRKYWNKDLNLVLFFFNHCTTLYSSVSDSAFLIIKNHYSMPEYIKAFSFFPLSFSKLMISSIVRAKILVARDPSLSSKPQTCQLAKWVPGPQILLLFLSSHFPKPSCKSPVSALCTFKHGLGFIIHKI